MSAPIVKTITPDNLQDERAQAMERISAALNEGHPFCFCAFKKGGIMTVAMCSAAHIAQMIVEVSHAGVLMLEDDN